MALTWKNGIKKWIRWLKSDRRNQRSVFESHSLILIALVGFFVNLTGAFLFCYFGEKRGKISAHFSQIKSGHNPGKTGQSVKIGCFRLEIFENFWPKMAICPLSAHFLPTFEKPKNLVFSRVSGFSAHFPTFFSY